MIPFLIGGAALGAYSAYAGAEASNKAASQAQENARRRYSLQASQAKNMMEEQQGIATEKMTELTIAFLKAKGKYATVQAETMVGGKTAQRVQSVTSAKEGEAKSKVVKEINTNIVNIASDMLTKKIDTEAMLREAESRKKNVFVETLMGGMQGAVAGATLGSAVATL